MMRFFRLFLAFMLTMALLAATALAAECTLCGNETGSEDYLCTDCLLSFLNQEPEPVPLKVTGAVQNADGSVTVAWEDEEANGPYAVYYELVQPAPAPFGWTAAEGVEGNAAVLDRLVPGVSYIITVTDRQGRAANITYYAPTPDTDSEIGAKIRLKPMVRQGRSTKQKTAFSAEEIMAHSGTEHGLYLRLTYSVLAKTRHYAFQIAVEAPNDFSDVIFSGTLELQHGRSSVPVWGFIPMDDYFRMLESYYGVIPTGEYEVTLYFNGQRVWSVPLSMAE